MQAIMDSPIGKIEITGDIEGIESIVFLSSDESIISKKIPEELADAVMQLNEYFRGERKEFHLKLSLKGTPFQIQVWEELLKIPFGKTASYKEMAARLGNPKVIRAAASANGKNPVAIVVPCHRVIGSDGSLTGYASGLERKKWLLELENPSTQQNLFKLLPQVSTRI